MTDARISARKLTYSLFDHVWWPKLCVFFSKFISEYVVYRKPNIPNTFYWSAAPLPISTSIFTSWSMVFVIDFPLLQCYNAIFVCMDHLIKYTKLFPCFLQEDILTIEQVALLIFKSMVQYFGISTYVIYDRDPRFTSDFGQSLWKQLRLRATAISAHHP